MHTASTTTRRSPAFDATNRAAVTSLPIADGPRAQLPSLLGLSSDVLLIIIETVSNMHDLDALSRTCTHMHGLCKPYMFREFSLELDQAITLERFPPSCVWPHIRYLHLRNACAHKELLVLRGWGPIALHPHSTIEYIPDPELGNMYDGLIRHAIPFNMQNLRCICLDTGRNNVADISLAALEGILSAPHLRKFKMLNHVIFWPGSNVHVADTQPIPAACGEGLAPLTSFVYDVGMVGIPPRYPAVFAIQALSTILCRLAPSLSTLRLPSIYTPFDSLSKAHWPLLRELTIQGEHQSDPPSSPCIALSFVNMPNLRVLNLELTHYGTLWPVGHVASFPWPFLEHLTLSHPSPDDPIFSHLPTSIRSLSLHSWPTQLYDNLLNSGKMALSAWPHLRRAPPLLSSTMLRVLRACSNAAGRLARLHVEYLVDGDENALLRFITSTFPSLTELEVHRARPEDMSPDPSWPLETLGHACAALKQLQALYVHADLSDYPRGIRISWRVKFYRNEQHECYATSKLLDAATALACTLAPSVRTIAFLTPDNTWPRWAIYTIHTVGDGKERVAQYLEHREARR
ncbi:hypothetical protein L226DRAFT_532727 [Lentinus tigrinus ALCF2SS1-7]|uniref:F-box domain-containing protein n=1 Tax=Lentinus tigrinus ALCF2SS1-6 TaxID=1328759 RepID=A0A5C2SEK2_9APHY|nr:hypothetical protein L227DRAFT_30193 [Lentinus tigrinus ALCF2SS1-6]RPD77978.1 hypothetical protein L226DRAFT_532727 [Lentinus tigrinus ALCF2SS1-7]